MIVEDVLASKHRPNLLRMGILLSTECLSAEFVVERLCEGGETGLDYAIG